MTTRKSLLTDTLNNEMKMIALVNEYDIKGEGDKIPKKVRDRYDTIMKSIKNHDNNYDDDDDFEKKMKRIEAVTKQNRSASRKKSSRRGGKTKRRRRSKRIKKKKN
jgi:hypothetical protein